MKIPISPLIFIVMSPLVCAMGDGGLKISPLPLAKLLAETPSPKTSPNAIEKLKQEEAHAMQETYPTETLTRSRRGSSFSSKDSTSSSPLKYVNIINSCSIQDSSSESNESLT